MAALIRERKTFQLPSVIQTGKREGMQAMDESILRLVREGVVTPRRGRGHVSSRELLGGMLKAVPGTSRAEAA